MLPAPAVVRTGFVVVALAACNRDPLPSPCPDVAAGSLVVTEIRGAQNNDADAYGEWIEIFNATGTTVDVSGLKVSLLKLDGSGAAEFLVRSDSLPLGAGGYAVLGRFPEASEPDHVDYGYQLDLDAALYTSGAIDLGSCGELIDRVIYRSLTDFGTLELDGAIAPTAEVNDDADAFCIDDALDESNPSAGVRGTPGEANPPCPSARRDRSPP